MYFTIQNSGVTDVESLITLGLSTSRGKSNTIGQFGSGFNMGMLALLRMGINPVVYCGKTKVEFYTEPAITSTGNNYNKVFVKIGNKRPRELSMSLEYGCIDWNSVSMGLREFVSNAIDATCGDMSKVNLGIKTSIPKYEDKTTVAVPLTPEVQRFYSEISTRFLHFANAGKSLDKKIISKNKKENARIYRKGVFVREIGKISSLFDYNFGEDIPIDEARNMDEYACSSAAADYITKDKEALKRIFIELTTVGSSEFWEKELSAVWQFQWNARNFSDTWKTAWYEAYSSKHVIISPNMSTIYDRAVAKGYIPVVIVDDSWYKYMMVAGIPTAISILDNVDTNGCEISDATDKVLCTFNKVWNTLSNLNMLNCKEKPQIKCFRKIMTGGSEIQGYYNDDVIYISLDYQESHGIMLEEIGHYLTNGASDCSRDLQNFAFQVAGALIQ